jgi:hypothetical protein
MIALPAGPFFPKRAVLSCHLTSRFLPYDNSPIARRLNLCTSTSTMLTLPLPVLGLIYSYTSNGRKFFSALDIRLLTLVQLIRLLVEPVLYWLALYHLVPTVMTFEGKNFDILTGLTVPFIYYFGFVRKTWPTWVMLMWNWMGIALLAVVVSIGVFSALQAPFAIQQFPWALLPGFLVPIAFFAHVGSIRLLAAESSRMSSSGASLQ